MRFSSLFPLPLSHWKLLQTAQPTKARVCLNLLPRPTCTRELPHWGASSVFSGLLSVPSCGGCNIQLSHHCLPLNSTESLSQSFWLHEELKKSLIPSPIESFSMFPIHCTTEEIMWKRLIWKYNTCYLKYVSDYTRHCHGIKYFHSLSYPKIPIDEKQSFPQRVITVQLQQAKKSWKYIHRTPK